MTRAAQRSARPRARRPGTAPSALAAAALLVGLPAAVHAQPVDPYAEPAAPAPKDPYGDPPAAPKLPDTPADPYPEPRPAAPQGGAPRDPYADPSPPPPPTATQDPYAGQDAAARELDEAIAASLVERAQLLLDQRAYADARQLAVEALVRSPDGPSAAAARAILASANRQLGIAEHDAGPGAATDGPPAPHPDGTVDPYDQAPSAPAGRRDRPDSGRALMTLYGVGAGVLAGTALGGLLSGDDAVGLAVGGLTGGVLGGIAGDRYADRTRLGRARARTIGSGATWGAVSLGFFADVLDLDGTTTTDVALGASIGALGGGALGAVIADRHQPGAGDIALVDSFAAWGVTGGFTLGLLMQPFEAEGYSLNAALGSAAGAAVGILAARRTELSADRVVRVNLWAYGGAAAPWLIYALAADDTTNDDEQLVGLFSTLGLAGGAIVGFQLTRGWSSGPSAATDAPAALLRRGSDGAWSMGGLALRPTASRLGPTLGRSALVDVVGVRF
jgi:hypothetical protein